MGEAVRLNFAAPPAPLTSKIEISGWLTVGVHVICANTARSAMNAAAADLGRGEAIFDFESLPPEINSA